MEAETVVLMVTIVVSVLGSTLATISLLLGPTGAKLGSGRQAEPPVVVATGLTGSIPSDS